MKFYESTIKETSIYTGSYLELVNVDVKLPDGNISNRDIIKHPGACAIIPFLSDTEIILLNSLENL